MKTNVADLRREYARQNLSVEEVLDDPIAQFKVWMQDAIDAELPEPTVMTLATATPDGVPSARIVLLKGVDERGLTFFTNYTSRKGEELAANPRVALVFYWNELERQVRVEGTVEQVTPEESDRYFRRRPRGSQLGAWASAQSRVVASRAVLEKEWEALAARYDGDEVPRPPHWGGYRVRPEVVEFWQGRPSRLHDRIRYRRSDDSTWICERLAP